MFLWQMCLAAVFYGFCCMINAIPITGSAVSRVTLSYSLHETQNVKGFVLLYL